jgi:hypothetical protein
VEAEGGERGRTDPFVPRFINGVDEVAIDGGLVRWLINPTDIKASHGSGGALLDLIVSGDDLRRASRRPEKNDH